MISLAHFDPPTRDVGAVVEDKRNGNLRFFDHLLNLQKLFP